MEDKKKLFSSSTRRGFLTGGTAVVTAVVGPTQSIGRAAGESATYKIGLPLTKRWTTGFADSAGIGSPKIRPGTITDDVIYLKKGETDYDPAKIIAYDIKNGETLWGTTAADYVSAPAVIDNTLLVSVATHLKAYSASEETTQPRWEYESDMDLVAWPTTMQGKFVVPEYNANPRSSGEHDYTYNDGRLSMYDKDGTRQWAINGDHIRSPYLYDDSIIHYEGHHYSDGDENHIVTGRVVSRDFETGRKQWSTKNYNIYDIRATSTDLVLARSRNDAIRGINTKNGNLKWEVGIGPGVEDYTAGPDHVYIAIGNALRAVHPQTGETIWSRSTLMPYDVSYNSGLIYVGGYNGNFYLLDAKTGETVWDVSHPRGDGFVRYGDGKLYLFSQNWVSAYTGQRGKALDALDAARSSSGLGTVSTTIANLLGREQALNRAETAIENQEYDAAMSAVESANIRKVAVEGTAALFAGGTGYVGTRKTGKHVQRYRLQSALETAENNYPVENGALSGLTPEKLIHQAQVARDSLEQSRWGPSLTDFTTQKDDHTELIRKLKHVNKSLRDIVELSNQLEKHSEDIEVTPWKHRFENHLNKDITSLNETVERCRRAVEFTEDYASVQASLPGGAFDLNVLGTLIEQVQSPDENRHQARVQFIEAALNALGAYTTVYHKLSLYDFSTVQNKIQTVIETDSSQYSTAREILIGVTKLLTLAQQAEEDRTNINYSYTDLTPAEVQQWIESALSRIAVDEMQEIRSTVRNLKRGIWETRDLHEYSPHEFEHLVADLYTDLGYDTRVTQGGSDGGIDVMARSSTETLAIQVKQYSSGNKIGRPTVQQTAGVREQFGADKAVVVTTSSFTGTAEEASHDYGHRMELVDGDALKTMLSQSSLVPPVQRNQRSHKRRRRQQRQHQQSGSRSHQQRTNGHGRSGRFCMVCGKHFQSSLETVETPDGETVRCCPRCKQLVEEATGAGDYERKEALKILGLEGGAPQDEIRAAYRDLVTEVHPDQNGSQEEFKKVQEAYEALQ